MTQESSDLGNSEVLYSVICWDCKQKNEEDWQENFNFGHADVEEFPGRVVQPQADILV